MLSANPFFDPKLMGRVIGDMASSLGSPTANCWFKCWIRS